MIMVRQGVSGLGFFFAPTSTTRQEAKEAPGQKRGSFALLSLHRLATLADRTQAQHTPQRPPKVVTTTRRRRRLAVVSRPQAVRGCVVDAKLSSILSAAQPSPPSSKAQSEACPRRNASPAGACKGREGVVNEAKEETPRSQRQRATAERQRGGVT